MAQSVTLSSIGTATMALNPVAKATTFQVAVATASTGAVQLEISLDDPTIPGFSSANITWSLASSAAAMATSVVFAGGNLTYTILSPVGMARLNSTATNGSVTLKALQSVTA